MAYAYQSIMGQLEPDKKPTDIFQQQPAAEVGVTGQEPGQPGVQKTQAGEAGASASAGETGQPSQESGAGTQQRAAGRAVEAASKKSWSPVDVTATTSKMQQASQALQDEADKYAATEKAKYNYAVTPEALEGAISGKAEDQAKTTGLLTKQFSDYAPQFQATTDTGFKDVGRLSSDLRGLLTERGGAGYTQQMADFDARALGKNKQFQETLKALSGQQQELASKRSALEDPMGALRTGVEEYGKGQLSTAQKQAQDYLAAQQAAIDAENAKEAGAWNQELAMLRGEPASTPKAPGGRGGYGASPAPSATGGFVANARDAMRNQIGGSSAALNASGADIQGLLDEIAKGQTGANNYGQFLRGESPDVLKSLGVDPSKFVNVAANADPTAFMSDADATRFNSIMGLLGKGGTAATAGTVGPKASFNRASAEKAIRDAASGKNTAADAAANDEIKRIIADATGRADKYNTTLKNFASPVQNARNALSATPGFSQDMIDYALTLGVDPTKYMQNVGDPVSGYEDVLTQQEVDALNRGYGELGTGQQAGLGRPYTEMGAPSFYDNAYVAAVKAALAKNPYQKPASGFQFDPNAFKGLGGLGNFTMNFDQGHNF